MSTRGKNIQLFLMDGEAGGRIKCTLANWTGVAYKIPRTELDKCKERDDLKQSGVYFLFGTSDETGKGVVYIGQAGARKNGEGILNRLQEHKRNPEKDYWTEAIVFTTSNNSFGPTEISYLENRFCNLALEANRYEVKNGNDPTPGNITEEKESEMEEFIDYAKVIMGTLGHKLFEPISKTVSQAAKGTSAILKDHSNLHLERTIKRIGKVEADGSQTSEGFVVFKGSHISLADDNTIPVVIKERRKNALIDEQGVLQEDMLFTSPSYAAMFVIGKSANGLTSWKTADGKTLKSLESGNDTEQTDET
ncbi:methionine sulfoxide reductase [Megasphaera hutchinsoni]|uniref:Methionine sulfoxide reductase n=1 Tax=Megasphaera hutchinsoni TaxID=1588748 RepID=A0A2J8BC02_9FIRM|nr:GIY-YIG nuclease family protein [Megasphaera genomosp. type_2]PNH22288.1 methionine sulfoxide reductase [Megasphaera genomosp. type_2]